MAVDNIAFKSFYYSLGTTSFRMQNFNQKIEQQLDLLDQFWHKTEYMNEKWESNESVQAIFLKEGDAPRKAKDALDYFIAEKTVTEKTFCKVVLNRKSKDYDRAYLPLYNAIKKVYFDDDRSDKAILALYEASDIGNVKTHWRKFLFKTSSGASIKKIKHLGNKGQNKTDIVFHPKIYLFKNAKEHASIVGNTNLTGGGLTSNFEVNTIFNEKDPIYYSQLQVIYNSIKYTDTLFVPDEEYLLQYSDVFKAFEQNEESARKDKGLKKVIDDISECEQNIPGTIPSIKAMIIDFMKQELQTEKRPSRWKMDTFRNSIRGELNHNEIGNAEMRPLHLFKREEKGLRYEGR